MTDKKPTILFKLPSRGRPERFFQALGSIVNHLAIPYAYHISCTIDEDDPSMNNNLVKEKIATYKNTSVSWGLSKSKIDAVNRGMPDIEWDILVVGSDDIFFNLYGMDEIIRYEMYQFFPEGDGYLHFCEKDSMAALCVMTCIDKKYYQRDNYIYHPSYFSLWADNEQMEVAKMRGRYAYIPTMIMEHRNPAYGYMERDAMFDEQQDIGWTTDHETFNRRKALNFEAK